MSAFPPKAAINVASAFHPLRTFQWHASLRIRNLGNGDLFVNWLWPRQLNTDDRISIRIVRLVHWCIVGFAVFGLGVTYIGLIEAGDGEPISICNRA